MDTSGIETMIRETCGEPQAKRELYELLIVVAARHGVAAKAEDLGRGAQFIIAYMEQVPYMLKVAITAASNVGLEHEMRQILGLVEGYWQNDEDVIPDHLGIIGLLDDAYCSLKTLQTFSDQYQLQTGKHMFPDDLSAANRVMRKIIGPPFTAELDDFVDRAIGDSGVMTSVQALAGEGKRRHLAANANIWNHGPAGEMPVAQLRPLGIVDDEG